jgi:hypothetical protein
MTTHVSMTSMPSASGRVTRKVFCTGHEAFSRPRIAREQGGVVPDLADDGGDPGVACLADEPYREITERGHYAAVGPVRTPGGILKECDIADPTDLVLDGPLAADVAGQVHRRSLACVQAGDDEHRDGGTDLGGLALAGVLLALADLAGYVPFDEGDLPDVREPGP